MKLPDPIAGRECGGCTVCCVEMEINDLELRKPDRHPCPHMLAGQGCAIHDRLPVTCRTWYCGWRFLHLSEAMRPDRAGVLLMPELGSAPGYAEGGLRIVLERREALMAEELRALIARCVAGCVPVYLGWGEGAFAKRVLVNPLVKPAVDAGDKRLFADLLAATLDRLIQQVAMDVIAAQA